MRNIYPIFLIVLLFSISCNKDVETPSLKELLQGNWNYQKLINSSYQSNGTLIKELITPINSEHYGYVFYDDGTCTQRFGGEPSKFSYKIISDTEFEVNTGYKNLCKIISIDATSVVFIIGGPQQTGSNYTTSTHYLFR